LDTPGVPRRGPQSADLSEPELKYTHIQGE